MIRRIVLCVLLIPICIVQNQYWLEYTTAIKKQADWVEKAVGPVIVQQNVVQKSETVQEQLPVQQSSHTVAAPRRVLLEESTEREHFDYAKLEQVIVNRLKYGYGPESDYYIVSQAPREFGFGNQFRGLLGALTVALVSGRRFRIMWDELFDVTNSSFSTLRFSSNETSPYLFKYYYKFPEKFRRRADELGNDVSRIFTRKYVLFNTLSDISGLVLNNSLYATNLRKMGFEWDNHSLQDVVHHRLSLLLLQPNDEIQSATDTFLASNTMDKCIGVQIRSGGTTAVNPEGKSFLSFGTVKQSANRINGNPKYAKRPVFLTTDSKVLNSFIPGMMHRLKVYSSNVFSIGHSSLHFTWGKEHLEALKRTIVDLLLIARCDDIFVTYGSSYGRLCDWLSNAQNVHILRN